MSEHPIDILSSVLEMAKAWQRAGNWLTRVCNGHENNENTLKRVCEDYDKAERLMNEHLSYKEQERLRERWSGTLPTMLGELLGRYKDTDTKLKAENALLRAKLASARAQLTAIGEWDCLNPPQKDFCSDLPWLRTVVDKALTDIGSSDS